MTESRDPFTAKKINKDTHDYSKLSIWCAVEALTYGTPSKSIEYAWDGDVSKRIAKENNIPYADFPGRIRAIVYLRNRWAHHARL